MPAPSIPPEPEMPVAALPDSVDARKLHKRLRRQVGQAIGDYAMIAEWEREHPGRAETIFSALQNVAPSQLADRDLFDFAGLEAAAGDEGHEAPPAAGRGVPIRWMTPPGGVRT